MGIEALIIGATAIAAGVGGGMAISKAAGGGDKPSVQAPQPLPAAPKPEDAAVKAEEAKRRKIAQSSKTVYTSPLGVQGEANVVRKTLLGQ